MPRPKRDKSKSTFARNLQRLRKAKGMSLRTLAEKADLSGPALVSSWEGGTSPEDYQAVKRIAEVLGVSFSYLMTGEDDRVVGKAPLTLDQLFIEGNKLSGIYKIELTQLIPTRSKEDGDDE